MQALGKPTRSGPQQQQQQQGSGGSTGARQGGAAGAGGLKSAQGNRKYFIIRSHNQANVDISVQTGGWATTRHNEVRLDEAFTTGAEVRMTSALRPSTCMHTHLLVQQTVAGF
jgi:hypothetical protein